MHWHLTSYLWMMVFQTTSVFNTNVGAAGMALGELWLVWDFVLVCKEQTAEGLWACTKKKCLAMLRRPCLGMPKRVSPRPSVWGKPDVCLPGVLWRRSLPCLPMEPATEVRAMWTCSSSNLTSITHTSETKIHAREDSPPLEQSRAEQSRAGWGGWLYGQTGTTRRKMPGSSCSVYQLYLPWPTVAGGAAQLVNCI